MLLVTRLTASTPENRAKLRNQGEQTKDGGGRDSQVRE
jgi:hypothetical protein